MQRLLPPILISYLLAAPASAEIYRWVNEQGQVHYSQQPPPKVGYERVRPAPPPGTSPHLDELVELQEERDKERAQAQEHAAQGAQEQAQRGARCAQAREQLGFLEARPPNRIATTGPDGEPVRMTAEDYDKRLADARKRVEENC